MSQDKISSFVKKIREQIVPRVREHTISFFHWRRDPQTNEYSILDKDRTGVLLRIGDGHFILTAAHEIDRIIDEEMILGMSWDDVEKVPIQIRNTDVALTRPDQSDVAAIKLDSEVAETLLRRHVALTMADLVPNCRASRGIFLITGYPRAGVIAEEQQWNDPEPHEIVTEPLNFLCSRLDDGWKHHMLKFDPDVHLVLGMRTNAVDELGGDRELPDHAGIEGISGCGVWLVADERTGNTLEDISFADCKLAAIEHSWDAASGRVAATWIDIGIRIIYEAFPETQPALKLAYPPPRRIWTP